MKLNETNQKIVDAIIRKGTEQIPGTLALISVHGSVLTGDTHRGSDLDLNIVINSDYCDELSSCFILEDTGIGYDIYCTSWKRLEQVSECRSPHISRLMDGEILYAADEEAKARFLTLRSKAADFLNAPFSAKDAEIVKEHTNLLKAAYFDAMTADSLSEVRTAAAWVVQEAIEAVMAAQKQYFRLGVKRTFDELRKCELPENFCDRILEIIRETDTEEVRRRLTLFVRDTDRFLAPYLRKAIPEKMPPSKENLAGTYEEMISNWHKKVGEAAIHHDVYSAFMAIASMQYMRNEEIAEEIDIPVQDVMECFDPSDLFGTFRRFEQALDTYREEYDKIGLSVRSFADADRFAADYLSSEPHE